MELPTPDQAHKLGRRAFGQVSELAVFAYEADAAGLVHNRRTIVLQADNVAPVERALPYGEWLWNIAAGTDAWEAYTEAFDAERQEWKHGHAFLDWDEGNLFLTFPDNVRPMALCDMWKQGDEDVSEMDDDDPIVGRLEATVHYTNWVMSFMYPCACGAHNWMCGCRS